MEDEFVSETDQSPIYYICMYSFTERPKYNEFLEVNKDFMPPIPDVVPPARYKLYFYVQSSKPRETFDHVNLVYWKGRLSSSDIDITEKTDIDLYDIYN